MRRDLIVLALALLKGAPHPRVSMVLSTKGKLYSTFSPSSIIMTTVSSPLVTRVSSSKVPTKGHRRKPTNTSLELQQCISQATSKEAPQRPADQYRTQVLAKTDGVSYHVVSSAPAARTEYISHTFSFLNRHEQLTLSETRSKHSFETSALPPSSNYYT